MLSELRQLKELSEIDALMAQTKEQLALYPKMLENLTAGEGHLRKKGEAAHAKMDAARTDRRRAEQEIASLRERIQKTLAQQGMVKTNKEYEAMTHEVEGLHAKIDALETRGLELLDTEEIASREQREAENQLQRALTENAAEKERIENQTRDKQAKLERLAAEQAGKFAELSDEWQQTYELMNARMPGTVAVRMVDGQCGGCHFTLTAGTQQHVRAGDTIVRCDHCRRVLFVE